MIYDLRFAIYAACVALCIAFGREAWAVPPLPVATTTGRIPLQWDASATPGVTYRLYHSTNNLTWHTTYGTGTNTAHTVSNVPAGTLNWFVVKAVNGDGIESDPSNVYEKPIAPKPAPPGNLFSVPVTVNVQTRTADGEWVTVRSYTEQLLATSAEPERQFRSEVTIGDKMPLTPIR